MATPEILSKSKKIQQNRKEPDPNKEIDVANRALDQVSGLERTHKFEISPEEQGLLKSINDKFQRAIGELNGVKPFLGRMANLEKFLISYTPKGAKETRRLNDKELAMVHKIMSINPRDFGITTPRVSEIKQLGSDKIQQVNTAPEVPLLPAQKESFEKMVIACQKETGETMKPIEGYRSEGYQLATFIKYLVDNEFNIEKTMHRVALPGYSEHQSATNPAMDIGIVSSESKPFMQFKSYQWLQRHAKEYGFILSFPEENQTGMQFESWHWKYIGSY